MALDDSVSSAVTRQLWHGLTPHLALPAHLHVAWNGGGGNRAEYNIEPEHYTISALGLSNMRVCLGYGVISQLARYSNGAVPLPPADT
jgi:hypothetical protein